MLKNEFGKLYAIGLTAFRESIRDKILYVLVVFGLVVIGGSLIAGSISLGQDNKILIDFGLAAISLFGLLIAIFSGANLVHKEIDKKTIYFLFSKPISPGELVVGKFGGLSATLLLIYTLFSIILMALIRWKTGSFNWLVLEAISLNYLEMLVIVGLVLIFSSFAAPLSAAIYTFLFYLIGHSMSILTTFIKDNPNRILNDILQGVYYIFPNLEKFNIRNDIIFGGGISWTQAGYTIGYALIYIIIGLFLSSIILKKREY